MIYNKRIGIFLQKDLFNATEQKKNSVELPLQNGIVCKIYWRSNKENGSWLAHGQFIGVKRLSLSLNI